MNVVEWTVKVKENMHVLLLDDDFAAVEPLPPDVVEVVLRDDDG